MKTYIKKEGFTTFYELECKSCGKPFVGKAMNQLYCSKECKPKQARPKKVSQITCQTCGKQCTGNKSKKYCSEACKRLANREKAREYERTRRPKKQSKAKHINLYCPKCGKEFITNRSDQKFCSRNCGKAFRGVGRIYTISKDVRLERATAVDKSVKLYTLIKRDNNVCQICGRQCDLYDYEVTASGAMICGDSYPTLDHVYPLSKGGTHTWDNVQLACMKCNREKSDLT